MERTIRSRSLPLKATNFCGITSVIARATRQNSGAATGSVIRDNRASPEDLNRPVVLLIDEIQA